VTSSPSYDPLPVLRHLAAAGVDDILAFPVGAPSYDRLKDAAVVADVEGYSVRFASLDHLIAMKEAAGRNKDKLMATEYRTLADEIRRRETQSDNG
jgi:hypothetical protein